MASDTPRIDEVERQCCGEWEGECLAAHVARQLERALAAARAEVEQLQVQLAGCSVAAMGGTKDPATPGMYGWSPAYQDVLALRQRVEELEGLLRQWKTCLEVPDPHKEGEGCEMCDMKERIDRALEKK